MTKTEVVRVRLTPEELERLDKLAHDSERSRSDFVRLLVKRADVNTLPSVTLAEDGQE